ncbi:MAG: CPBP family intramembrane glutamic endopeptidase [Acidobacteriota bacterium]
MNFFGKTSASEETLVFISLSLLSYIFYFVITHSNKIKNKFIRKYGKEKTKIYWVLFQRGIGVFLYGLIPGFVILIFFSGKFFSYGLSLVNFAESIPWILGMSVIVILFSILNAQSPSQQKKYPQIQTDEWSLSLILLSSSSWIVYLFSYELFLRGIIFFSCLKSYGLWTSVIINILIYAFFHLHKNSKEIIGSLFLGFAFCLLTYRTGAIWTALLVHIMLALSSEWASIHFNPEMKIKVVGDRK